MTKKIRLQAPFGDLGCQRPEGTHPVFHESEEYNLQEYLLITSWTTCIASLLCKIF